MNLDWGINSPKKVFKRFGFNPKVYVRFFDFPMSVEDEKILYETAKFKKAGVKTFVRFAHEMNGSWYPWIQSPTDYKNAFAKLVNAIHKFNGKNATMIWAPNYGGGYPFFGGQYEIKPDSPDFPMLDTNLVESGFF